MAREKIAKTKIDKSVQKTLIIVFGIIVLILIIIVAINNFTYSRTISSTGTATIEVLPDLIAIYFNIETTGVNASRASKKNAEIVEMMETALLKEGIARDEIKTESFSVYPDYDYRSESPILRGYRAAHIIKVKIPINEKNKIGGVIDAGVKAGAGISYINYELNDENQRKYKADAIRMATEDGRIKAEALADGSGNKLGPLISISSNGGDYAPWIAADSSTVAGKSGVEIATTINPSEQEVTAMVTAVFRIR